MAYSPLLLHFPGLTKFGRCLLYSGEKIFGSQPKIVQVVPLKKMRDLFFLFNIKKIIFIVGTLEL